MAQHCCSESSHVMPSCESAAWYNPEPCHSVDLPLAVQTLRCMHNMVRPCAGLLILCRWATGTQRANQQQPLSASGLPPQMAVQCLVMPAASGCLMPMRPVKSQSTQSSEALWLALQRLTLSCNCALHYGELCSQPVCNANNAPCCRGSGPGAAEEARTIKFELPPVPKSVNHGEAAAKGFHFPTSEGFMFEAAAGVMPCLMLMLGHNLTERCIWVTSHTAPHAEAHVQYALTCWRICYSAWRGPQQGHRDARVSRAPATGALLPAPFRSMIQFCGIKTLWLLLLCRDVPLHQTGAPFAL